MVSTTTDEASLKKLIQQYRDSPAATFLPDELNIIIESFLPSQSSSIRAQALLFLSKYSSDIRQKYSAQSDSQIATSVLVRTFSAPVEARLADTQEFTTLSALWFLVALFQVDWLSACDIFLRDGLLDAVMDTPDVHPSSTAIPVAVGNLLSQASGHKSCRPSVASPQVKHWLDMSTQQTKNPAQRAAAAVTLVKLSRGSANDAQSNTLSGISLATNNPSEGIDAGADDRLVELMKSLVISESHSSSSTLDAVEGLAYLTVQADVKESISADSTFLKHLMGLVPQRPSAPSFPASHTDRNTDTQDPDHGLSYGISVIISNLCTYKPHLSEEERQIEKLKRMTKEPGAGGKLSANTTKKSNLEELDDDNHVRIRAKRLTDAGVVEALTGIIKNIGGGGAEKRSIAVQRMVGKAFLGLSEDKTNRGKILQGGGAKALLIIARASIAELPPSDMNAKGIDGLDSSDLLAIQALAKLSITSPPTAVFGPAQDSYVDAIRPFAILLTHSSSSLLQRFEAAMALTNVASINPEAAERVSAFHLTTGSSQGGKTAVGDIVKRAEALLLDSNTMLRRAATELICNLVGGAEGSFDYFGGTASFNAKSKLQILVALSDVEDLPTRLAASGALAILTVSPHTCQSLAKLELERHRVLPTLVELISPKIAREYREERPEDDVETAEDEDKGDPGLVHRGIVCVRNLFANLDANEERKSMSLEAEKGGLVRALILTIKSSPGGVENGAILKPAADVLKWIVQAGVKLPL
ncbi:hypothetical protein K439DRAFT_1631140 [Ramaria rubella]|nr:hypothetical protein K439DRAFT_1631140 [Ramaria rubella]